MQLNEYNFEYSHNPVLLLQVLKDGEVYEFTTWERLIDAVKEWADVADAVDFHRAGEGFSSLDDEYEWYVTNIEEILNDCGYEVNTVLL